MSETTQVNFNCPVELLTEFDESWKGRYNDRTSALLGLLREFIKYRKAIKAAKGAQ